MTLEVIADYGDCHIVKESEEYFLIHANGKKEGPWRINREPKNLNEGYSDIVFDNRISEYLLGLSPVIY